MTRTLTFPYRPSANYTKCHGTDDGKWYQPAAGHCYNGKKMTTLIGFGNLALRKT